MGHMQRKKRAMRELQGLARPKVTRLATRRAIAAHAALEDYFRNLSSAPFSLMSAFQDAIDTGARDFRTEYDVATKRYYAASIQAALEQHLDDR